MLRWTILLGTLLLWIAAMAAIYFNFRPREENVDARISSKTLNRYFSEGSTEEQLERTGWRIYIDPEEVKSVNLAQIPISGTKTARRLSYNGVNEDKLTHVGWFYSELKRNSKDPTRVRQVNDLLIKFPDQIKNDVFLLKTIGDIIYDSSAEITMNEGIDNFTCKLVLGFGLDVKALGVRNGENFTLTVNPVLNEKSLGSTPVVTPIGSRSVPNLEMFPFQPYPDIDVGKEWEVLMFEMRVDLADSNPIKPKPTVVKAKCTRKTTIQHEEETKAVFEVESDDGCSRAWYAPNGTVLKQNYRLMGMINIVLVSVVDQVKLGKFITEKRAARVRGIK